MHIHLPGDFGWQYFEKLLFLVVFSSSPLKEGEKDNSLLPKKPFRLDLYGTEIFLFQAMKVNVFAKEAYFSCCHLFITLHIL